MRHISQKILIVWCVYFTPPSPVFGQSDATIYQRSVDTEENVRNKLFPKNGKWEVNAPGLGMILNQSYVDTLLIGGGLTYYFSEEWGIGIQAHMAQNSDKPERECLENFYNDYEEQIGAACGSEGADNSSVLFDGKGNPVTGANFGPAYAAVREIQYLGSIYASWNPIYGKQIAFLSFTSYFDLFFNLGLGAVMSDYYPATLYLRNQQLSRAPAPDDVPPGCPKTAGVCPSDPDAANLVGAAGRPDPEPEVSPMVSVSLGQKLHFKKHFHFKAELSYITLLGGEAGYEPYVAVQTGLGVRF